MITNSYILKGFFCFTSPVTEYQIKLPVACDRLGYIITTITIIECA